MLNPVRELLYYKGGQVHCIAPDASVAEAVHLMNRARIGALVVLDGGGPVGMFTERDVLVRVVDAGLDASVTRVADVMTTEVHALRPGDTIQEAMKRITDTRCRHFPVLDEGQLVGLVSIGDLLRWMVYDRDHQIEELMHYITDTGAVAGSEM